jgi:hypothetical protein
MPNQDGTGPQGQGKGRGPCGQAGQAGQENSARGGLGGQCNRNRRGQAQNSGVKATTTEGLK